MHETKQFKTYGYSKQRENRWKISRLTPPKNEKKKREKKLRENEGQEFDFRASGAFIRGENNCIKDLCQLYSKRLPPNPFQTDLKSLKV